MTSPGGGSGGASLSGPFLEVGSSSFAEFLSAYAPELLPGARSAALGPGSAAELTAHGTTIVAATGKDCAVMAGDRRATMGNVIAQRDIEKVFPADELSCVGIAGAAGIAVELVRLFQVELEHYEKIEGARLSMEGKANRLGTLLRGNLGLAMQGLAAVPLLTGYDRRTGRGRIFSYDVTGGRYEEHDFHAIGSGSVFARGSLKKLYRSQAPVDEVVLTVLHALYDAADDDSATGLPDVLRGIFPIVAVVDAAGYRRLSDQEVGEAVRAVVSQRAGRPDGPAADVAARNRRRRS